MAKVSKAQKTLIEAATLGLYNTLKMEKQTCQKIDSYTLAMVVFTAEMVVFIAESIVKGDSDYCDFLDFAKVAIYFYRNIDDWSKESFKAYCVKEQYRL